MSSKSRSSRCCSTTGEGYPHEREIGQRSVDWTLAHTGERAKRFMHELPFDLRFELGGKRIRLVPGSPRKVNEYLFEDKPARTFERIARTTLDPHGARHGLRHAAAVSLRKRLTLLSAGGIALVLIVGSAATYLLQRHQLRGQVDADLARASRLVFVQRSVAGKGEVTTGSKRFRSLPRAAGKTLMIGGAQAKFGSVPPTSSGSIAKAGSRRRASTE